ncbi:YegP family protein [Mycobacterium sp. 852002-51971_SCH5477799-a]|uniref:YegP family protein n=1 Tax=Mycobacterium sp. 852002-51971_SCH5477799-a TaxID=1834106 RepID=UPI0009EF0743|nr:YegP family protein [Mycobacterium sp. 852002-51971_SCH5477799-a]
MPIPSQAANGELIATSEGYCTKASENGGKSVQTNAAGTHCGGQDGVTQLG